ncbi:hypothetical protein PFICI_09122 [Pestalotiopsis fici W106-1]|uniref:Heterokaryon incompatibility domain-containing protein n=1 Tax=Pestalotiopsis fici (strain W106-1 / CGMCC3.15140) TaxID=1229662 RepID=W3WZT1_PESFW|nr:uncharacterized protein PFICI_09122 [Pestalotiopsis fici W106-1]ETS79269.1 hypothetical protein PFICI_09122 [Pestalotiopsis fici W106-1]
MRLLRLGAQDELNEYQFNHDPPRYAIFSHTWGPPEEEYTFQDLIQKQSQDKKGYQKILSFGKQAKLDGLDFFWVDTCCIDKTSSAEVAEAINSMFRWYRNAQKCYVYLEDVVYFHGADIDTQFRKARWFTRRWTLQELIAPRIVEFFLHDWKSLGSKEALKEVIHEITGIPLSVLQGRSPSDFPVNELIMWTRGRDTTRPEDQAYSLLGIFDITMVPMYGEGAENALARLRKILYEEFDWPRPKTLSLDLVARKDPERDIKEEEEEEEEDNSEPEDVESIFSDTDASMSSKSSVELNPVRVSGIREITRVFLGHDEFKSLCTAAINNVAAGKSRAHIRGFLKNYGNHLDEEARNPLQHQAARFVREVAGRIADEIRWSITGFDEVRERETTAEEKPNLEKWLSTVGEGDMEKAPPPPPADDNDSDSDGSDDGLITDDTFPHIEAVQDFLLSSNAFETLLRAFENWTNLKRRPDSDTKPTASPTPQSQETIDFNKPVVHNVMLPVDHLMPSTSDNVEKSTPDGSVIDPNPGPRSRAESLRSLIWSILDFWGVLFSFHDLMDLFVARHPVGYERVRWRCSCNTVLWGDFPVDDSHALAQLKEDLLNNFSPASNHSKSGSAGKGSMGHISEHHGEQQAPSHEKADQASTTSNLNKTAGSSDASSFPRRESGNLSELVSEASNLTTSNQHPVGLTKVTVDRGESIYFEVCTDIGNSAVGHFEIDITQTATDGELFEKIWDIYNRNRGVGLRRLFLRPCNVHFVLFSISTVKTTQYSAGIHEKPAEYPPDEELQRRRYHYHTPKLMMPPHVFIHFLHRARWNVWGDHANDTWLKRLPKKLNESMLAAQASEASSDPDLAFGWGVHILDGPNHAVLGFFLAAGLLITFVISCLILGIAKTQEQAFGVGQYLIAILVALMSAVYFKLQDQ